MPSKLNCEICCNRSTKRGMPYTFIDIVVDHSDSFDVVFVRSLRGLYPIYISGPPAVAMLVVHIHVSILLIILIFLCTSCIYLIH